MDPFTAAAAGVATSEIQDQIHKQIHGDEEGNKIEEMRHLIHALHYDLRTVADYYRHIMAPPLDVVITLQGQPGGIILNTHGRRFNMILVPVANPAPQIIAEIPGIGALTFNPQTGWNEMDFADGTEIYLATPGSSLSVLLRCSNTPMGANVI